MKKLILIIAAGMVAVSLIWMVDKTSLAKESAPKTAEKQQESAAERRGSTMAPKKTTGNPTSKPPVYDLSKKAHWYDPKRQKLARAGYCSPNCCFLFIPRQRNSSSSLNTKTRSKNSGNPCPKTSATP